LVLVTENLALRQQLVVLRRSTKNPGFVTEIGCSESLCRIYGETGTPSCSS